MHICIMRKLAMFIIIAILALFVIVVIVHQNYAHERILLIYKGTIHPFVPPYIFLMFLSLKLFLAYLVQAVLSNCDISVPFDVFISMAGFLWGIFAYHDEVIRVVSAYTRISPKEMLFLYTPVIIFHISISLDTHMFIRCFSQILIVGIPVSILTGVTLGFFAKVILDPTWDIVYGILLGIFCIPTYPRTIKKFLRYQSARTRQISVLLESEALFTIIIAHITKEIMVGHLAEVLLYWHQYVLVLLRFIVIDLFTGYIFGHLGQYSIRTMYNDRLSVYVLLFALPIFLYSLSHIYLSGCGSISVMVMGVMIGRQRTVLPKDIEKFLTDFWEVTSYVMDVITCFKSSMAVAFFIATDLTWKNYIMVTVVYLMYYVIRFLYFFLFSPLLSRLGYGMDVKSMAVCVWSGLKGPYCVQLIEVFNEFELAPYLIVAHQYFYLMGLYFLSIIINGSLIFKVLEFLGFTQISVVRQVNMSNCMKHIFTKRERTIAALKVDRFLADTNWPIVIEATNMKHPYQVDMKDTEYEDNFFPGYRFTYCGDCKKEFFQEPTAKEMKDMTREARMRVLKAKKMSYYRQYENGMMTKECIRILTHAVELAMDLDEAMIEVRDLHKKFTEENCCQRFVRKQAEQIAEFKTKIKRPRTYWRRVCYHIIVKSRRFEEIMLGLVAVNLVIMGFDMHFHISLASVTRGPVHSADVDYFFLTEKCAFVCLYLIEFIMKVMAFSWIHVWSHGFRAYFKSLWNVTDFVVLVGFILDLIINLDDYITGYHLESESYLADRFRQVIDGILIMRALRLLKVFEIFYPDIIRYLDKTHDKKLAFTYELGRSYTTGETEILDMLPFLIDNKKIRENMKQKIEADRLLITKLLGTVQKERPWIAITVKTKQAIRTILCSMNETIHQLKTSGWVDTYEYDRLQFSMNELYKKINAIKRVQPSPPKVIFKEVAWMDDDEAVIDFLFENVTVKRFQPGEVVFQEGTVADGIYIVVTGLFFVNYTPEKSVLDGLHEFGRLPIADYFSGTKYEEPGIEYIVSGNCIGERSTLTERAYNSTITAEAHSQVYVLSRGVLKRAMELNPDPIIGLECRIWKEVSVRIAVPLLLSVPAYQAFSQEQIKYALERAFVPNLTRYKIFVVTDMIEEIILVEGVIADFNTNEMFIAPCCIPRTVQKLILPTSSLLKLPIDVETKLLIIPEKDVDEYDVMINAEEVCEMVDSGSSSKCLQHAARNIINRQKHRKTQGLQRFPGRMDDNHSTRSSGGTGTVSSYASSRYSEKSAAMIYQSYKLEVPSSITETSELDNEEERSEVTYQEAEILSRTKSLASLQLEAAQSSFTKLSPKRKQSFFFT